MIEARCRDCGAFFTAIVILGITSCPECKGTNTCAATWEEAKTEMDRDFNMSGEKA